MTGFFNALSATLVLLMLMAVGYGMGAAGWMTASEKRFISKYIINIAVPCNCISGLLNNLDHNQLLDMGVMVVAGTLSVCATLVMSILLAMVVRPTHERWGVFVAMTAFSNTLFIGLPVSTQLFGQACLPYVMTYYLGHTLIVQSVGHPDGAVLYYSVDFGSAPAQLFHDLGGVHQRLRLSHGADLLRIYPV